MDTTGRWVEGLTADSAIWNHQWRNKGSQPGFGVKETSQFLLVKSTDNGATWSKPENITRMGKQEDWWLWAPAPGQGITLRDGTLVFPVQGRDKTGRGFSTISYSKDGGKTWKTGKRAAPESTTENMAVEQTDGSIMLNMRSGINNRDTGRTNGRVIAVTDNLGESWRKHSTSRGALPEPACMASIVRHRYVKNGQEKNILLFSNPDAKTARKNLTVKVSFDDGKTWPADKKVLLDEEKSRGYSCLTSVDEHTIGILYESSQADLVFQTIDILEIL
nr:sialidase family protein [Chitinophaga chungangae]